MTLRDWLGEAKAKQVYLVLRDRILSGAMPVVQSYRRKTSSPRSTACRRVTVRRALGKLSRERLIERRRSAGTRVVDRPVLAPMTADISGMLTTFVPESVSLTFTRQELASRPLLDLLERAGGKVDHARQRFSASLAAPDVAAAGSLRLRNRSGPLGDAEEGMVARPAPVR